MTTLVGIIAKKGKPGVVLASDVIATGEIRDRKGDVEFIRRQQQAASKIFLNRDKDLAIAMAGTYDDKFKEFLYDLREGNMDFEAAARDKRFESFLRLNLSRTDGRMMAETNSLLIASRTANDPRLYSCWPLGLVQEVTSFTSIGSGSPYALGYLGHEIGTKVPREISIAEAIRHAEGSIRHAGMDIYTKGFDVSVITADKISQYGDRIDRAAGKAVAKEMKRILREYE